jgi:hypothetical protein
VWLGVLALAALIGVLVGLALLADWRGRRSVRALAQPHLEVPPGPYALGDRVRCRLTATVGTPLRIERAAFLLVCTEGVQWTDVEMRNGEERRTTRSASEEVWVREEPVAVAETWRAGEALDLVAEFDLPLDGPPSFRAAHNQIAWGARFRAVVRDGSEAVFSQGIEVEAARRLSALEAGPP